MHQRIHDRADARTGKIRDGELPAVGQLGGDHVAPPHPQPRQSHGHPVGQGGKLAKAEPLLAALVGLHGGQRDLVRAGRHAIVQQVVDRAVPPPPARNALRPARRNQYGVEIHGYISLEVVMVPARQARPAGHAGTARRPARLRAMMIFMICAVPSPI
ncbi:hypothetical protein D3C86_1646390 [compost metagenome]